MFPLCLVGVAKRMQIHQLSQRIRSPEIRHSQGDGSTFSNLNTFSCETMDGGMFTQDDFANKELTVMNFWMTTCAPCVQEMPKLEEIRGTLPDNVQMVLVCLDADTEEEAAKEIIGRTGYTGLVTKSGDGDMEKVNSQILYVPTTLLFDAEGNRVGSTIVGSSPDLEGVYTEAINTALSEMDKEAEWKK